MKGLILLLLTLPAGNRIKAEDCGSSHFAINGATIALTDQDEKNIKTSRLLEANVQKVVEGIKRKPVS